MLAIIALPESRSRTVTLPDSLRALSQLPPFNRRAYIVLAVLTFSTILAELRYKKLLARFPVLFYAHIAKFKASASYQYPINLKWNIHGLGGLGGCGDISSRLSSPFSFAIMKMMVHGCHAQLSTRNENICREYGYHS